MKWASKILDIMENKKVSVGNVATAVKGLGLEIARPGTSVLAV